MPLIHLVIILAVVGLILWLIITYIPMPQIIQRIIIAVVVICVVIYLLQVFGVMGDLTTVRVGHR